MRVNAKAAAVVMASGLALALGASEGAAKYRAHTMEAIGGHMSAIVDIVRGDVPHTDHLPTHAGALAELAQIVPSLFAEGSEGGDTLPAVWEQPEDFQAKLGAFKDATASLKAAAEAKEGVGQALRAVGQACKSCHDTYRAE